MLRGQWRVHEPPSVLAQCRQLARQALPFGLVLHNEPGISGPPAVVGEAEEGERFRPPRAAPLMREGREPAKLDQPLCTLAGGCVPRSNARMVDKATADNRPELQIFADDLTCGHDATSGTSTTGARVPSACAARLRKTRRPC